MEDKKRAIISDMAESAFGKRGKLVIDISLFFVDTAQRKKEVKRKKWEILSNKNYDKNYQFNEIIIKNFVPRKLYYYGTKGKKHVSIHKIKHEIEHNNYVQRNIIITGAAGIGKSTVLKWLFYKSNISNCNMVYLYAKMFLECTSLDEFLTNVMDRIPNNKRCIVFFDGLDELPFITGTNYEFQQIIRFFDQKSNFDQKENVCRFVISTRTEHFEFHKMFVEKNIENTPDNYLIYEINILTKKETFKICKSIKKLNKYERKNNINEFAYHFIDKWPSKEMENMPITTEKEYIKLLKKYIKTTMVNDSLLNSPLYCRYAYQFICDWSVQNKNQLNQNYKTQSDRIYGVLRAYIKQEFHDHSNLQTEGGIGKEEYKKYECEVSDFLVQIARLMGKKDYIDRKQWESLLNDKKAFPKLKNDKKNLTNAAVCVLQENANGGLEFIHNIFKDYFLALYYSQIKIVEKSNDNENLTVLLKSNSEFAIMYIEQLIKSPNELIKRVIKELIEIENYNLQKISEYANGTLKFIYTSQLAFTIEEYLTVFPCGFVMYAGIIFNKEVLDNLCIDGILEVKDAYLLADCNQNVLSKNNYVKGISLATVPQLCSIDFLFLSYINKEFFLYREEHQIDVANIDNIYLMFEQENEKMSKCEEEDKDRLKIIAKNIIKFIGDDNNYWCLFDLSLCTIIFYQMIPKNEEKIVNLFEKGCSDNLYRYIITYGNYLAHILDETEFVCKVSFQELNNIHFVFDSNITLLETDNICAMYYDIYEEILSIIQCKIAEICYTKKTLELIDDLKYVEPFLSKSLNKKFNMFFSDINLLALYILNESIDMREEIIKLAQDTFAICEEYQHIEGKKFREFLLGEDISYDDSYLKKVYEFAKKYIWI